MNTKNIIMRRVYYSFTLSVVGSGAFWQGAILGGSIALFGRLTHVAALIENVLAVPLGQVPSYVFSTFLEAATHGELLTVLVTILIMMIAFSFGARVYRVGQLPVQMA